MKETQLPRITVKLKLISSGIATSILMCLILGLVVYFFNNLSNGFHQIVTSSQNGVEQTTKSSQTITKINDQLTSLAKEMEQITT